MSHSLNQLLGSYLSGKNANIHHHTTVRSHPGIISYQRSAVSLYHFSMIMPENTNDLLKNALNNLKNREQ
ncbi:hypothetical protein [Planktothricoides raciborskii]|uniref:hypothetical protein n=1 Tax=Planktothricoides raciborskii TaxID=132608 RepID=UPI001681D702|nr:hypothetical protein [Planktothricoides raciborskii]MBD2585356.1 hypothetical protein [Planktothricoides raciborskii FACHB-1261]